MKKSRPLIICDCDEVLMHMVAPFRDWLDTVHHIHFDFASGFEEALRHKHSGDAVEQVRVWTLLNAFFATEMRRQQPINGAVSAMQRLATHADVVILTNIGQEHVPARTAQLKTHAMPFPVVGNRGGKGPAAERLMRQYRPSVTLFIDDLASNHVSLAATVPQVWRLHLVGEPEIAVHIPPSRHAHARIDQWAEAEAWLMARIDSSGAAPSAAA
jgi:hypothetical protein